MILTVDSQNVSFQSKNTRVGRANAMWSREEFTQLFGVAIPEEVHHLGVETDVALYTKVTKTEDGQPNQAETFENYTDDPLMTQLAGVKTVLKRAAELVMLQAQAAYPDDVFTDTGDEWVLEPNPNEPHWKARAFVAKHGSELMIALSILWDIAGRKNLFDGENVPQFITNLMTTVSSKRDDFLSHDPNA